MYTENKQRMNRLGLDTVFISPCNIGEMVVNNDKNIIIGDWENSDGISQCIEKLNSRMKIKEDGEIEL